MINKSEVVKVVKSGVQAGVTNFTIPALDIFVAQYPHWIIPWMVTRGFFGVLFAYQQEKINWFVKYLEENRDVFSEEVVKTSSFQEGFVLTFENYIKQRSEARRKIIEQIFLDFTTAVDRESFELERLYRTSELISFDSTRFISFILKEVTPDLLLQLGDSEPKLKDISELLGQFFDRESHQNLYPEFFNTQQESVAELTTLGIMTNKGSRGITYNGGSQLSYTFTKFGLRFIGYVMTTEASGVIQASEIAIPNK